MASPKQKGFAGRRKRNNKLEDVPMTPMIDVVFQLLIYFVYTFEIPDIISKLQVWRPAAPQQSQSQEIDTYRIMVYEGFYTLDETRVSLETLERTFNRLADLDPTQNIIVMATAESFHGELVTLLDLLKKSGLENVSLLSAE